MRDSQRPTTLRIFTACYMDSITLHTNIYIYIYMHIYFLIFVVYLIKLSSYKYEGRSGSIKMRSIFRKYEYYDLLCYKDLQLDVSQQLLLRNDG
jgi:hypothetical protein